MGEKSMKERLYRMRVYPVDADTPEVEWVAEVPDLPGCVGSGDTPEEAIAMARDAQKGWIDFALKNGKAVPEPSYISDEQFSGKFTLRLPKTMHKDLVNGAEEEGVSLNQYLLFLISKGLYGKEMNYPKSDPGAIYQMASMHYTMVHETGDSYKTEDVASKSK